MDLGNSQRVGLVRSAVLHVLPPRPFLDALAVRVTLVWLLIRVAAAMGSAAYLTPYPASVTGPLITVPVVVGAVIIAVRFEMGRRSELVFLANLGHSFGKIAALVAAQCLVFEAVMRLSVV